VPICQRRLGLCHVVGMMVGEDDDNAPQELQPALAWQPARRSFNNEYLSNLTRHLDILNPHHRIQAGVRIPRCASDERLRSGSCRCCSPFFSFLRPFDTCVLWVTIATPRGSHCREEPPDLKNLKVPKYRYLSTYVISLGHPRACCSRF